MQRRRIPPLVPLELYHAVTRHEAGGMQPGTAADGWVGGTMCRWPRASKSLPRIITSISHWTGDCPPGDAAAESDSLACTRPRPVHSCSQYAGLKMLSRTTCADSSHGARHWPQTSHSRGPLLGILSESMPAYIVNGGAMDAWVRPGTPAANARNDKIQLSGASAEPGYHRGCPRSMLGPGWAGPRFLKH